MALSAAGAHGQTLVYMVTYVNTPASFRAQYPNGVFGTTQQQKVAMTRQTLKNEIWSVSAQSGRRTLLFSDAGMGFEILPSNGTSYAVDDARKVAYVVGVERTWEAPPKRATPGVYETPRGIYEIALDGSKHIRRLFDATQNMSAAMVNIAGTRVAFYGWEDKGGYFLYVHELPSGKLLTRTNITKVLQAHCANCLPQEAGWLADGKRLYFTLEEGDEDGDPSVAAADVTGTYLVSEQGSDLGSFPAHAGEIYSPDYVRETSIAPYLIAQVADGTLLFRDYGEKRGPMSKRSAVLDEVLVFTDAQFKVREQIPLGTRNASAFALAPDGKFLAFVEDRHVPDYKTERHMWARNLKTDEEKELLYVPPVNPPNSPKPNENAAILGWLQN